MRKLLFLLAIVLLKVTSASAVFYPVTHQSGTQNVGGQNVTVTPIFPPLYGAQSVCGSGPYFIGGLKADGFNFQFVSASTIRMNFTDFHDNDTVIITDNTGGPGYTPFVLTAANLTAFAGTCAAPNTVTVHPTDPNVLVSSGTPFGVGAGQTVTFSAPPGFMKNISVFHTHRNPSSGGVIFSVEYENDSCNIPYKVTSNTPCATRNLELNATNFSNATFAWTGPGGYTATGANPVYTNVPFFIAPPSGTSGYFVATAQWGTCTFKDSVLVDIKRTPSIDSLIIIDTPVCKGSDLLLVANVGNVVSTPKYTWTGVSWPSGTIDKDSITINGFNSGNVGWHKIFAESTDGCLSDTVDFYLRMSEEVTALFTYDLRYGMWDTARNIYGCANDTITFKDLSIFEQMKVPGDSVNWKTTVYMHPVKSNTTIMSPAIATDIRGGEFTHLVPVNLRDTVPDTFDLRVIVTNGNCVDSMSQRIVIHHPVFAAFVPDKDVICQGTEVEFFDRSYKVPNTSVNYYVWDFKDGDTSWAENPKHTFNYSRTGTYEVTLTLTNFLGCKDSFKHTIIVDSTGSIIITASDTVICVGDNINFSGVYEKQGNTGLEWRFGDGDNVVGTDMTQHSFDSPGEYNVEFMSYARICPTKVDGKKIKVNAYPLVDLGKDTVICPNGAPVVITDSINRLNMGATWLWNNNKKDNTSSIIARHPGVYSASVTIDGCTTTDSLTVFKDCYVDLPNAFTPDGDGYNDYFLPRNMLSKGVEKFKLAIFNRWGQLIFETNNAMGLGWDGNMNGEKQPQGVYIYQLDVTFKNKTAEHYTGNVTLLR